MIIRTKIVAATAALAGGALHLGGRVAQRGADLVDVDGGAQDTDAERIQRLLRTLVGLLDEWTPVIEGSELAEHPFEPITHASRRRAEAELAEAETVLAAARAEEEFLRHAVAEQISVREATLALGFVERGELTEEQLDQELDLLGLLLGGK